MVATIKINDKELGKDKPCFIIAEAGINHNGDIKTAKEMIKVAKEAGVDAIKFQTFTAEEFIKDHDEEYEYESQGKKVKESMIKMFKRHEFSKEEWESIANYCKEQDIIFFSTPQNESNLNLLLDIGIPLIKVGSDDLTNLPLLETYAKKDIPMMISTGMANIQEVEEAVDTIKKYNNQLVIFHCISSYPTDLNELNLNAIHSLKEKFKDDIIGFSDHSEGILAAIVSTAKGSKVFEKHFTLDKNMPGPDHMFSADPEEISLIVRKIRETETSLGDYEKKPTEKETEMIKVARRSIVSIKDIEEGEELTLDNISLKRPGTGIEPKFIREVIGKKAKTNIKKNTILKWESIIR